MAVTINDVAIHAKVSKSAVSRTFTDGASVSTKMRNKVERSAEILGYRPNILASSLTTNRTKLIGLITNNYKNPYFMELFDLFTRGLQAVGLKPLLVNLSDATDPKESAELLLQYCVDAVIFVGSEPYPGFSKAIRDANIPVIHSFGRVAGNTQVHTVNCDDKQCGMLAAQSLITKGYKSVGFIGGSSKMQVITDRLDGFKQELAKHQEIKLTISFAGAHSYEAGNKEMNRLLQKPHAEAYFCSDDILCIGAMSAIEKAGLSVPNDIGIIGMNDMDMAGWSNINLTTINQPTNQIVSSTIELTQAILENLDRYPETRLFSSTVVERGTLKNVPSLAQGMQRPLKDLTPA